MKKGFTLIELMGVLVVIGLVFLVAVPNVTNSIRKSRENEYKDLIKNLELSASNYVETKTYLFPHLTTAGNKGAVEIQTLVDEKYVKSPIINPITDEEIPLTHIIEITVQADKSLEYEYIAKNNGVSSYNKEDLVIWYDGYNESINKLWNDKSGIGNNASVTGGKWDKYYWKQESNQDVLQTKDPVNITTDFTFQVVISDLSLDSSTLLNGIVSSATESGYFLGITGTSEEYSIKYYANTLEANASTMAVQNEPRYITFVASNQDLYLYLDGVLLATNSVAQTVMNSNVQLLIGRSSTNLRTYGKYHSIMIYNRALTADEVYHNYEINKLRYGV